MKRRGRGYHVTHRIHGLDTSHGKHPLCHTHWHSNRPIFDLLLEAITSNLDIVTCPSCRATLASHPQAYNRTLAHWRLHGETGNEKGRKVSRSEATRQVDGPFSSRPLTFEKEQTGQAVKNTETKEYVAFPASAGLQTELFTIARPLARRTAIRSAGPEAPPLEGSTPTRRED